MGLNPGTLFRAIVSAKFDATFSPNSKALCDIKKTIGAQPCNNYRQIVTYSRTEAARILVTLLVYLLSQSALKHG